MAYAIGVSRPKLSPGTRKVWAKALIDVATRYNFDPLSGWAIIDHESGWRPGAVSADGHDVGLAQIRYSFMPACRKGLETEACRAAKAALFDPTTNMRRMGGIIDSWRKQCKKTTGRAEMKHWLAGYGGYSRPRQGKMCGRVRTSKGWRDLPIPKGVREIIQARRAMIRRLEKRRRKGTG